MYKLEQVYRVFIITTSLTHRIQAVLLLTQVTMYQSLMCPSYTQNGILNMLDRNRRLKQRPERFQECQETFDLIITVEERVYDQVVECM